MGGHVKFESPVPHNATRGLLLIITPSPEARRSTRRINLNLNRGSVRREADGNERVLVLSKLNDRYERDV